jgi:hypothetical protein
MRIVLEVPDFDGALHMTWEEDYELIAQVEYGVIHIRGNRAGLISLARLALTLADERVESGAHWHLDPMPVGGLEPGSASLIVGREDSPTRA